MRMPITALYGATLFILSANALALQEPRQGRADPRVKTFVYNPDEVYTITGYFGYETHVQFAPYETVESIPIGDSTAWQVIPVQDSGITLKPINDNAHTNMTVITSKRVYHFELNGSKVTSAIRNPQITFGVKFRYPEDERLAAEMELRKQKAIIKPAVGPNDWNMDYTFAGDKAIAPIHAMDDGQFMFLSWSEGAAIPAIFYVNPDLSESVVNWRKEGRFIVIERLGRQFTFRHGKQEACLFNDGYQKIKRTDNMPRQSAIKVVK